MRPASSTAAAVAALFAVVAASSRSVVAFAPAASTKLAQHVTNAAATASDTTDSIQMPLTFEEMIKLASSAVSDAYEQGITRQMVRVLLPRDPASGDLGVQYENDAVVNGRNQDMVLVPPDETWQGGSPQLYRACAPTAQEIIRRVSKDVGGVSPLLLFPFSTIYIFILSHLTVSPHPPFFSTGIRTPPPMRRPSLKRMTSSREVETVEEDLRR